MQMSQNIYEVYKHVKKLIIITDKTGINKHLLHLKMLNQI